MKLSNREKNIAFICALAIVVYGFYWVNSQGVGGQGRALLKSIKERRQVLEKDTAVLQEASRINEQYASYIEQFGQKGSLEQEMTTAISDVEAVALKHKVQITNFQPQRIVEKDGYQEIGIQIVVSGTYLAIIGCVAELQNRPYWMDVKEIRLEKAYSVTDVVGGRLLLVKGIVAKK